MNNKNNNVYGFGPYNMFLFNYWKPDNKENNEPQHMENNGKISTFLSKYFDMKVTQSISDKTVDMSQQIPIEIPIENSTQTYIINKDNTLTYPDGHNEPIFSAETCGPNPSLCFSITPGTQSRFGKTIKTLEFYKKTKTDDNDEAITTLIVPTNTDIFFNNKSQSNQCNKRVSKAIVRNNVLLKTNEKIPVTRSLLDANFKYKINTVVIPKNGFDDYGEWVYDNYPSSGTGIHVLSTKDKAKEYEY